MRTGLLLLLALLPAPLAAQFKLPLLPPLGADTVCATKVAVALPKPVQPAPDESAQARQSRLDADQTRLTAFFDGATSRFATDPCVPHFGKDSIRGLILAGVTAERIVADGLDSDEGARAVYGNNKVRYLSSIEALVDDDQLYVASELMSGVVGRSYFDLTGAKVVSRGTAPPSDDAGSDEAFRDQVGRITGLLNNGGSLAGHFAFPTYVGGGTLSQRSFGFVVNAGVVGDLADADSAAIAAGGVVEFSNAWAVRNPQTYERSGEIFLAARAGLTWVLRDGFVDPANTGDRTLPFFQFGLGLRSGGSSVVNLLYTKVPDPLSRYVPRVLLAINTGMGND